MSRLTRGLRDLAYYLEDHPEIPNPSGEVMRVHVTPEEFIAAARVMGGDIDVSASGKFVTCTRAFGVMALAIQTSRRELLGEPEPDPDVSDRVRALIDGAVAA